MDTSTASSIGWYGKLPSRGDFVGSGLPRAWLRRWDDWLQQALARAARQLGAAALRERLVAMPAWQLLVPASEAPAPAWSGVVVASADRVGRVFPLLVVEACDAATLDRMALIDVHARARRLGASVAAARSGSSPKEFDACLAPVAATPWIAPSALDTPADGVAALRARWPAAGSFWWRLDDAGEPAPPLAEDWPPRDGLLLDWLGG